MRKVVGLLTLAIGLGVLATSALAPVDAQDKDPKAKVDPKAKAKVDPKAKAKAEEPAGGTVEIYKAKDGYRFRVKDGDGKTLAMPARGLETKDDVLKVLEEVKATLNKVKPVEVKD